MRADFDRWWLLPIGVLVFSALIALDLLFSWPISVGGTEIARRATSGEAPENCSGTLTTDYTCHQERYRELVLDSGVEAAFAELKDEYGKNDFLKATCHRLTHEMGRVAAERYGDVPGAFSRGEHLCGTGYYHGVIEAVVARIGVDTLLEEADTLCADLRSEDQRYSVYHHGCVHGLGHGFMGVHENELFEALGACDTLTDRWEREQCYNGVFMENMPHDDDWSHPPKYIKADQPLYPCTDVEARYKNQCYQQQTSYALLTQGNDFVKVFELCGEVEEEFRRACYQGLGRNALGEGITDNVTEVAQVESAGMLCMLGEDQEAQANCVVGAVRGFILFHHDVQAKVFCESLDDANLRAVCDRAGDKYYEDFALD